MKLGLILWSLFVFGTYGFCTYLKLDLFLILWISLAVLGLIFFVADSATAKTLGSKKFNMFTTSETDINQQIEDRRKAILEDKSPLSTTLAYASIPLFLCLIHHYLFF